MGDSRNDAGDDVRWVNYRELAAARGITPSSATRLAMRKHWRREPGNDGKARVAVPLAELTPEHGDNHSAAIPVIIPDDTMTNDTAAQLLERIEVIEAALQERLERERERADRAEAQAERAEARAADASREREEARVRAAAAEGEAKALRDALDHARRPAWRRWFGLA